MVELYRQVDAGTISLKDRLVVGPNISWTFASGHLRMLKDRPELSVGDLCRLMIYVSDDMATDVLMDRVGLLNVNATLAGLGIENTRVNMTMGEWHYPMVNMAGLPTNDENDKKALAFKRAGVRNYDAISYSDSIKNNVASPRDLAKLLRLIHERKLVSASASDGMLEMLKSCQNRNMIPKHISEDVVIAHKHGSSGRIKGDAGVVYLPSRPLIITAFAYGSDDKAGPQDAIARLAFLAVKAFAFDKVIQ
ncbi:MAG: serine hydrolase [SAR202 cluster bacterium]|nr:serine hydrolase [SAR202 cluster bacterium]